MKKAKNKLRSYLTSIAEQVDVKKVNHERSYECKFCGKKFPNGNKLEDHTQMH